MQERGDRFVLIAAILDDQGGDAEQVGDVWGLLGSLVLYTEVVGVAATVVWSNR